MRRVFLHKFTSFILIFLFLHSLLSYVFSEFVLSKTGLAVRDAQLAEVAKTINILVIGDSHSLNSIKPDLLDDNAFSLAVGGLSYMQTYYRLKYVFENEKKHDIQLVILPFDLHSFSSQRSDNIYERPYYWKKYIDYWEYWENRGEISEYFSLKLSSELPYLAGVSDLQRYVRSRLTRSLSGAETIEGDFSKSQNPRYLAEQRVIEQFSGYDYFDPEAAFYFEKILELCKQNQTDIVLVKFPVTREYFEEASQFVSAENLYDLAQELLNNTEDVFVLDHQDLYFDENYLFVNPDHLNVLGREKFTILLRQELISLDLIAAESK